MVSDSKAEAHELPVACRVDRDANAQRVTPRLRDLDANGPSMLRWSRLLVAKEKHSARLMAHVRSQSATHTAPEVSPCRIDGAVTVPTRGRTWCQHERPMGDMNAACRRGGRGSRRARRCSVCARRQRGFFKGLAGYSKVSQRSQRSKIRVWTRASSAAQTPRRRTAGPRRPDSGSGGAAVRDIDTGRRAIESVEERGLQRRRWSLQRRREPLATKADHGRGDWI